MTEYEKRISDLLEAIQEEKSKVEEIVKSLNHEHSEELKELHSQHHRQVLVCFTFRSV